ncbi:hypothetical protein EMVG_00119 [Emiliania huxleyi virus PS401]|nr:hypothetical protein EMVG_00119 [Emiliania huxleyi virus PS401]
MRMEGMGAATPAARASPLAPPPLARPWPLSEQTCAALCALCALCRAQSRSASRCVCQQWGTAAPDVCSWRGANARHAVQKGCVGRGGRRRGHAPGRGRQKPATCMNGGRPQRRVYKKNTERTENPFCVHRRLLDRYTFRNAKPPPAPAPASMRPAR